MQPPSPRETCAEFNDPEAAALTLPRRFRLRNRQDQTLAQVKRGESFATPQFPRDEPTLQNRVVCATETKNRGRNTSRPATLPIITVTSPSPVRQVQRRLPAPDINQQFHDRDRDYSSELPPSECYATYNCDDEGRDTPMETRRSYNQPHWYRTPYRSHGDSDSGSESTLVGNDPSRSHSPQSQFPESSSRSTLGNTASLLDLSSGNGHASPAAHHLPPHVQKELTRSASPIGRVRHRSGPSTRRTMHHDMVRSSSSRAPSPSTVMPSSVASRRRLPSPPWARDMYTVTAQASRDARSGLAVAPPASAVEREGHNPRRCTRSTHANTNRSSTTTMPDRHPIRAQGTRNTVEEEQDELAAGDETAEPELEPRQSQRGQPVEVIDVDADEESTIEVDSDEEEVDQLLAPNNNNTLNSENDSPNSDDDSPWSSNDSPWSSDLSSRPIINLSSEVLRSARLLSSNGFWGAKQLKLVNKLGLDDDLEHDGDDSEHDGDDLERDGNDSEQGGDDSDPDSEEQSKESSGLEGTLVSGGKYQEGRSVPNLTRKNLKRPRAEVEQDEHGESMIGSGSKAKKRRSTREAPSTSPKPKSSVSSRGTRSQTKPPTTPRTIAQPKATTRRKHNSSAHCNSSAPATKSTSRASTSTDRRLLEAGNKPLPVIRPTKNVKQLFGELDSCQQSSLRPPTIATSLSHTRLATPCTQQSKTPTRRGGKSLAQSDNTRSGSGGKSVSAKKGVPLSTGKASLDVIPRQLTVQELLKRKVPTGNCALEDSSRAPKKRRT